MAFATVLLTFSRWLRAGSTSAMMAVFIWVALGTVGSLRFGGLRFGSGVSGLPYLEFRSYGLGFIRRSPRTSTVGGLRF